MKNYLLVFISIFLCITACKKNVGPPAPQIININPDKGSAYLQVYITELHFDSVSTNTVVKFNGVTATIYSSNDTTLVVIVPVNATTGKITVTINGITVTSKNDFEILPGTWTQKAGMPESAEERCCGIGFAIGNYGYIGLGNYYGIDDDELYRYDPSSDSWSQMASFGTPTEELVCMVINNIAYAGLGLSQGSNSNQFPQHFYAYDPQTNTWTQKSDFPGAGRQEAVSFTIGNKGYVVLGIAGDSIYKDVWEYDPVADSWTQKKDFPGVIPQQPFGFALDSVAYVGGAVSPTTNTSWWQYNPATDTWTQKNNYPSGMYSLYFASSMVINGQGYILGGGDENWRYNPATDTWTQLAFFASRVGGFTFVVNNNGYFGAGAQGFFYSDLWEFTPPQ
jgi:N-acetylneuraminic acid mutarotase